MAGSRRDSERLVALEFVVTVLLRTVTGFREQEGLLGPSTYGAIVIAYSFLAMLVLSDVTAPLAPILGLLIVLAVLLRPAGERGTLGGATARALAGFAQRVGAAPPTTAGGYGASSTAAPARPGPGDPAGPGVAPGVPGGGGSPAALAGTPAPGTVGRWGLGTVG